MKDISPPNLFEKLLPSRKYFIFDDKILKYDYGKTHTALKLLDTTIESVY